MEMMFSLKRIIADYTIKQEAKAIAEEERKLKIREIADAKREAKGQSKIIEPVNTVERKEATTRTAHGSATTKKVWKFRIENEAKMYTDPIFSQQLMVLVKKKGLDEQVLRNMVKDGSRDIKGVEVYPDVDVSVSATKLL